MRPEGRTVEQELARLASRAHGVVTRRQLLDAGISACAIKRRVADGSLIPQHRGVYRVGHCAPSVDASYMAAVLACGDAAALCGRSAGHLLGLSRDRSPEPEVIALTERRIEGIRTHR